MKVTVEYAQQHLLELLDLADSGVEVEITREGRPSCKLVVIAEGEDTLQDR